MKCPHCNGRTFSTIDEVEYTVEYNANDEVVYGEAGAYLCEKKDSHMCKTCDKELKNSELIQEKKDG